MIDELNTTYAGFWRRLGAGLIDSGVLLPVMFIVWVLEGLSRPAAIFATILGQAAYYSYILLLTVRYGGTLGKLALGMRVQAADGSSLDWGHVWRRSAVDMVGSTFFILGTIAGIGKVPFTTYAAAGWMERSELLIAAVPWMMWLNAVYMVWLGSEFVVILTNRKRRALHDFIAGTVVVVLPRPVVMIPKGSVRLPAA